MKIQFIKTTILGLLLLAAGCVDNSLDVKPKADNFPLQVILDADEGGDLPDAEDYDLEVTFADYLPDAELPDEVITLSYAIHDFEDDMTGGVTIDKITYEVELDGCMYERELDFTVSGDTELTGTITVAPDEDLGSIPETFEIIFALPGLEDTEGKFTFELTSIEAPDNIILGSPFQFEYEVLDNDVAGEWEMEIASEEEFEAFREVFAPLNSELSELEFADITGKLTAEFEYGKMKFVLELVETEEETTCEDGVSETETVNKEIEIEADYDAEDGELEFEGSYVLTGDDGEIEGELDFIMEASYEIELDVLTLSFLKVIDEDNFEEGEELFISEEGNIFEFIKD